ncbi:metal ABC transporter ATP-binding protein [Roseinatronobacter alkalisoli]|uniref:Metal ABC transporter ATP-binding protein n=1 Tax=Roseinatronobacter alkalisoli TaxID=3028235 RepID=A0ABT5TBT6_9RHOB|nr:metal ABC transporter ATP-binding protein [Roseinatronobacter sp. HJB301]MDD7971836.1 metal ABC transporter ATP-binding protein [Roseinatronobacter sp. HJB301]
MREDMLHEPDQALHVEDLTVSYGATPALWDIDLDIPPGVMCAIVGPNGAGKSTLLKAALGLVRPVAGHVRFLGRPVAQMRGQIGYVPQRHSVDWDFPTTVRDVVEMGLYRHIGWLRRPGKAAHARAMAALAEMGMQDYADRQISQLSGGQQQRVFIARALVQDAPILVLDEPMAGVDASTEAVIIALLKRLRDEGRTIIVVHHDLTTVQSYFDWLVMLNIRIIAQGPVNDVYTAQNLRAAYGRHLAMIAVPSEGAAP